MENQHLIPQPQRTSSLEIAEIRKITENGQLPIERRTMAAYSCPKIRDSESDLEIKQFILFAMTAIGFPPERYPEELEKILLVNLIKSEYGKYSVEELRLAFLFAVTRKFLVDLRFFSDSRFNFEYISRVISAYDRYTSELISAELRRQKFEEFMKDTEWKELSPEEDLKCGKDQFEFVLRIFKEENRPPMIAAWSSIFRHLEHEKKITDTREEKQLFFETVQAQMAEETTQKLQERTGDVRLTEELRRINQGDIKIECRKRRIMEYVKFLIQNEQAELPQHESSERN